LIRVQTILIIATGTISNELFQTANLALLCEDLVNGMIAASEWGGLSDLSSLAGNPRQQTHRGRINGVEIVMDIEQHHNWIFKVQAGALRRVIM
jgi:hypothetical protein